MRPRRSPAGGRVLSASYRPQPARSLYRLAHQPAREATTTAREATTTLRHIFLEILEVNGCFRDTEDMLRNGDRRGEPWTGTMSVFLLQGRWLLSSEWTRRQLPGGRLPAASAA